nr:cellulose synthase-like protein D5 [Tanacetum cinerariifolium]
TKEKVRSGGGSDVGGAGRYLSILKDGGGHEYVAYTVHIPPTPDHQFMDNSQDSLEYGNVQGDPNENWVKDRVFTGWFETKTRAHAKRMKSVEVSNLKSKLLCQVNGCDQKLFVNPPN